MSNDTLRLGLYTHARLLDIPPSPFYFFKSQAKKSKERYPFFFLFSIQNFSQETVGVSMKFVLLLTIGRGQDQEKSHWEKPR
jgi:hypothetical protein